ncbi:MAG: hypothetical protein QUS12_09175, partial [Methanosarcina sp.]|nr:hypothetical protein [Methanosarcina sp.]
LYSRQYIFSIIFKRKETNILSQRGKENSRLKPGYKQRMQVKTNGECNSGSSLQGKKETCSIT